VKHSRENAFVVVYQTHVLFEFTEYFCGNPNRSDRQGISNTKTSLIVSVCLCHEVNGYAFCFTVEM